MNNLVGLLKDTFVGWREDRAAEKAAALAFYTLFSLAPILVIAITVAGLLFDQEAARGYVSEQIDQLIGQQAAATVEEAIASTREQAQGGLVATGAGLAALLLGATAVFRQLYTSLNHMWEVEPTEKGLWSTIQTYLLSLTMVLGVGFLLLVSLILSAVLAALGEVARGLLPGPDLAFQVLDVVISLGSITLLFALIYKYVPEVRIAWRDVWVGAGVTAVLFVIGKELIGLYLGQSSISETYGAAGSLAVVLIWVYYSAQILFLGAEFTHVYARRHRSRIKPEADAKRLEDEAEEPVPASPRE